MARRQLTDDQVRALEALLSPPSPEGPALILALAWRAGLTRGEICDLTWTQADLGAGALRLPDRTVPLEPGLTERLRQRRRRCQRFSPWVAASERRKTRLSPGYVSHIARAALDAGGLDGLRLADLRRDYVYRQYLARGWPYALSVAGLSAAALREELGAAEPPPEEDPGEGDRRLRLWRVMREEPVLPVRAAVCLAYEQGLRPGEMLALTWDAFDPAAGTLALPDRTLRLTPVTLRALADLRDAGEPGDDPHLLLTGRDRRPMDPGWLSTLTATVLTRAGLEGETLRSLRRDPGREERERRALALAQSAGGVTRRQVTELLGLSRGAAAALLSDLRQRGDLDYQGGKYYPAGLTLPREEQPAAVCRFLAENGPAYRQAIVNLLHVSPRSAGSLLRRMTDDGVLVLLPNKQYTLPSGE